MGGKWPEKEVGGGVGGGGAGVEAGIVRAETVCLGFLLCIYYKVVTFSQTSFGSV